jgi:hypothetical protein
MARIRARARNSNDHRARPVPVLRPDGRGVVPLYVATTVAYGWVRSVLACLHTDTGWFIFVKKTCIKI